MVTTKKVVLVTGCSTGGIGFHLCEAFAKSCKVYATSRHLASMDGFKDLSIEKLAMDVTNDEDVDRVIKAIVDAEGKIDIVVNNAGVLGISPLIDLSLERVHHIFDTNTFAALRIAKAVIPFMAKRRSGLIINIGSISGEISTPWNGIYNASKAALHSLTEVLQMECRPFNIKIMLVSPGSVKSKLADNQAATFKLPPESLYIGYLHNIMERLYASQRKNTMSTEVFAQMVVSKALLKNPPFYFSAGGNTILFALLKWLPRSWAMFLLWRQFSRPKST